MFENDVQRNLASQFCARFFHCLDNAREELLDAYHSSAIFSLSISPGKLDNVVGKEGEMSDPMTEYLAHNHNLLKCTTPKARIHRMVVSNRLGFTKVASCSTLTK